MNYKITPLGIIGIIILANGTLIGGTNYLADLFNAKSVTMIVAVAGLGNMFLGGLVTMFSTQSAQIKNVVADPQAQESLIRAVLAMRGVEHIDVNRDANATLAKVAVDPTVSKIAPIQAAQAAVQATAASAA